MSVNLKNTTNNFDLPPTYFDRTEYVHYM